MKLQEITYQHRRDFSGVYVCEGCGDVEEKKGCYDDDYFHQVVTPKMECKKCGETTNTLGLKPQEVETKYPASQVV